MPMWSEVPAVSTVTPGSIAPAPSQPAGPSPGAATSVTPSGSPVRLATDSESRPTTSPARRTTLGARVAGTSHSSQSGARALLLGRRRGRRTPRTSGRRQPPSSRSASRSAMYPAGMSIRHARSNSAGRSLLHHTAFGARYGVSPPSSKRRRPCVAMTRSIWAAARPSSHDRWGETAWPSSSTSTSHPSGL